MHDRDAVGRRPVYVAAGVLNVVAGFGLAVSHSFLAFAVVAVLTGAFRALDSGPLEAWFVDTVHAERPGADVDQPLARTGAWLGGSIALGALLSGALVWWDPAAALGSPGHALDTALKEFDADILGMSALLTTTMPYMKVVIDTLKEQGIRDDYIVLVGGAPLNEEFGRAIGADAYCRDAAVAVETAKGLMARKHNRLPAG